MSKLPLDWVQDHSLLIIEAKKPGEMPDVMGQAQFYTQWTKAIAYIVTDGVDIQGYYRNPVSSDDTFLNCKVCDLPDCGEAERFSYQRIKAIKDIDFTEEIEKRINIDILDKNILKQAEKRIPVEIINYMRIVLGDDSDGLCDKDVANMYMSSMSLSSEGRYIPKFPFGLSSELIDTEDALLYIDGKIVPFMNGTIKRYRFLLYERIIFENEYLLFDILCAEDNVISITNGFHVQDYSVSSRSYNLSRVKRAMDSNQITIRTKRKTIVDINVQSIIKECAYCIAQEGILDYWISRMDQLKTIEEFYGIEFHLRPGLNANETEELYNTATIVYDGIAKRRNITFLNEAKNFFLELALEETVTLKCSDLKNVKWTNLEIHNYRFIPDKISIIPKKNRNVDISVEFLAEEILCKMSYPR